MSRDQIIIGGAGFLLLAFLFWGYKKFVAAPTDLSAPSNIEMFNAARIKPATVLNFRKADAKSSAYSLSSDCGCLFPWLSKS